MITYDYEIHRNFENEIKLKLYQINVPSNQCSIKLMFYQITVLLVWLCLKRMNTLTEQLEQDWKASLSDFKVWASMGWKKLLKLKCLLT